MVFDVDNLRFAGNLDFINNGDAAMKESRIRLTGRRATNISEAVSQDSLRRDFINHFPRGLVGNVRTEHSARRDLDAEGGTNSVAMWC